MFVYLVNMENQALNGVKIHVSNPHRWERTELVQINSLKIPASLVGKSLQLYNSENEEITSQISINPDKSFSLKFLVENVPPLDSKVYYFKKRDPQAEFHPPAEGLMDGNDYYIENDLFRIVVENDGNYTLMQKIELEEESQNAEEKLIIMGEELGAGSIWAGEEYLKYFHFGSFWYNETPFKWQSSESCLIEASDFIGTLKVSLIPTDKMNLNSTIETIISIQKGESSLIRFKSHISSEKILNKTQLKLSFPIPFESYHTWENENFIMIMDESNQIGFAVICKEVQFKVFTDETHKRSNIVLNFEANSHLEAKQFNFEYAVIPIIKNEDQSIKYLIKQVKHYEMEYFTPLEVKLEL